LNRNSVTSLDTFVGELLREEQRLLIQGAMSSDTYFHRCTMVSFEGAQSSICCHFLRLSWPIGYVLRRVFDSFGPLR
jgi:hypothetical protein